MVRSNPTPHWINPALTAQRPTGYAIILARYQLEKYSTYLFAVVGFERGSGVVRVSLRLVSLNSLPRCDANVFISFTKGEAGGTPRCRL
mmetsp:Transcript_19/g.33  ORF Transcript_19/g.33 Transcript_19/m.33 type:complete len:89 (+) Transcript_19:500-766(+)